MITEETLEARLQNLEEAKEHYARMILRLGEAGEALSKLVGSLQAEVELLAVKAYTEKPKTPRKARSDRGKKRGKGGPNEPNIS